MDVMDSGLLSDAAMLVTGTKHFYIMTCTNLDLLGNVYVYSL